MADRNEVVVYIAKDGRMAVDVEHQDPEQCRKLTARARAAYALLGMKFEPGHDEPVRAVPIPELERTKGGG